jgi:DNA-binding HxlR family transcriptional regulator/putative sterol carrier protein
MPKRSYRQHCALARALDLVGERWTLLLVRELLGGAKRYKELLAGVPGMGTNLLAARLKDLVEAGLVAHDGARYTLTARGAELEPAVVALARFGAPLLGVRDPEELWSASWNVVALKYAFHPERAAGLAGVLEFRVADSLVQARIEGQDIETCASAKWAPDATLITDEETFLALGAGSLDLGAAIETGAVTIEGHAEFASQALAAFASGDPVEGSR